MATIDMSQVINIRPETRKIYFILCKSIIENFDEFSLNEKI